MKENLLHYNYQTEVCEKYDMTLKEALLVLKSEEEKARQKKHALILTRKDKEQKSFFDAWASKTLSRNFTWIHFSPQEILGFDEENQEEKYYIMVFSACEKE